MLCNLIKLIAKRSSLIFIFTFVFGFVVSTPAGAQSSDFDETKRKIATVALFGLGGAGLGLLTVASSAEPQGRLSNVTTGLVLGSIVGFVYVFNSGDRIAIQPLIDPTNEKLGVLTSFQF